MESRTRGRRCRRGNKLHRQLWWRIGSLRGLAEVRLCCDGSGVDASEVRKWDEWVLTERVGLETAWWDASETAKEISCECFDTA